MKPLAAAIIRCRELSDLIFGSRILLPFYPTMRLHRTTSFCLGEATIAVPWPGTQSLLFGILQHWGERGN